MATQTHEPKKFDLPPTGPSNPDPITDAPGSHPIETGIGAALVGAAGGLLAGAVGGPIGAVIGAAIGGAVVGGLAGKGVGELIDPTTEGEWIEEYMRTRTENPFDRKPEEYRPAYRYGIGASHQHRGRSFDEVEADLRTNWLQARGDSTMEWDEAREAVHHAYGLATERGITAEPPPRNSNVASRV